MYRVNKRLDFLYERRNIYLKRLEQLGHKLLKNYDESDEDKLDKFFQDRNMVFVALERVNNNIMSIFKNNSLDMSRFESKDNEARELMRRILDQDSKLILKINRFMKEMGAGLKRIGDIERYALTL